MLVLYERLVWCRGYVRVSEVRLGWSKVVTRVRFEARHRVVRCEVGCEVVQVLLVPTQKAVGTVGTVGCLVQTRKVNRRFGAQWRRLGEVKTGEFGW